MYRCEASTIEGFIQQLAVSYIPNGYWFYVTGTIPEHKNPQKTDEKIMAQYDCAVSKWVRARRKRAGLANIQYLRFRRFFVVLATHGKHQFFEAERKNIRDIRETPIKFARYAIGCGKWRATWHPSVRIEKGVYRAIEQQFLATALQLSRARLFADFEALRFEPYAPVRFQLLQLLRSLNRKREVAGLEPLPATVLKLCRHPVRPFEDEYAPFENVKQEE